MHKKCVLLITCTVGYGHQAAAMNIEQSLRQQNPDIEIFYLDTRQYFPQGIAQVSDQWDNQMRKGHFAISQVSQGQGIFESFYDFFLDHRLTRDIQKLFTQHPIDAVYDMQPMFTASLYKAFCKATTGRALTYHKILTDLPTPRNTSYFKSIQRGRYDSHVKFKIHAPDPLLAPKQTVESFWKTFCNVPATDIENSYALPVHAQYLNQPTEPNHLHIVVEPRWNLTLPLSADTFVTTLMLGSQGINAIYDYVTRYLDQIMANPPKQQHYFFIACSKNESLYNSLESLLAEHPLHRDTPHRVIPLKMQTMDAIASLMWRSNQVIIRSGGISSLEQVALGQARANSRARLLIHSSYKGNDPEALLKHTYAWERGNAEYLIHHLGAKMTAPQLIEFFTS